MHQVISAAVRRIVMVVHHTGRVVVQGLHTVVLAHHTAVQVLHTDLVVVQHPGMPGTHPELAT
jgi:hypothetical protein